MPSKHNLSVSLTGHLCDLIEEQVASGRFRSASEVVRAALRLLERDLADPAQARPDAQDESAVAARDRASISAPPRWRTA